MSPAFSALLLVSFALIQAKQPATQPSVEGATIEGRVLKAGTDEPLKKALLTLESIGGERRHQNTTTDASGRFILKNIDPGRYMLWADRNGFVRQPYGQRGSETAGTTVTVGAGQNLRDITFRLIPAAVITGRVFDEDGEPVAGVSVQVMKYRFREGKRELLPAAMGDRTNDLGEYRVYGLAPGQYFVSATLAAGWGRTAAAFVQEAGGKSEDSYPPTYYPGTNDPARATPLELRTGEIASGIDIGLMPTRSVRVRGRVFNAVTGQPGRDTEVVLVPREPGAMRFMSRHSTYVEDAQGAFEILGVTPGSYTLEAHSWSDNKDYTARLPLEVGTTDIDGVNLTIAAGAQIPGRVRVEGDAQLALSSLHVFLNPAEEMIMYGGQDATVKPDGSFVLPNVYDGEYRVDVWQLPEDCYLKAVRLGGESVLETGLKVSSGQAGGSLDMVISSQGGRVEGAVLKEGLPFSGAHVVLVPDGPSRTQTRLFRQGNTDQYGHFVLRGIVPGDYKLFAWEELETGAYQDPEFLKRYEDQGEPVRIEENGRGAAQLKLIPPEAKSP